MSNIFSFCYYLVNKYITGRWKGRESEEVKGKKKGKEMGKEGEGK